MFDRHNCSASWLFDFKCSESFRRQLALDIAESDATQVEELAAQLDNLWTEDEKLTLLRNQFPSIYVSHLISINKQEELDSLFDGTVTMDNMFWYIHVELLPKLTKMRREN